ncbi:hypothetical protein ACLQ3C_16925 [Gordonia sp. DT30]
MGLHYPEPDFNAVADEDDDPHAGRGRQFIAYGGVILSLLALLVILYVTM